MCKFEQDSVRFWGYEVGSGKRSPCDVKIEVIQEFPKPSTNTQVRSFLEMTGHYSCYIKDYGIIAVPLTNALKGKVKKEKTEWSEYCEKAFQELKGKLTQNPVFYALDYSQEFIVQPDASLYGAAIVPSQVRDNQHPILYSSKKFSGEDQNYSTIEHELVAIVYGPKKITV